MTSVVYDRIQDNRFGKVLITLIPYLVVTCVCFIALYCNYDLGEIDISYPFSYQGDELAMDALIKGVAETGTWWYNPRLGGAYGQSLVAYPYVDALSLYMMAAISLFTDNSFLIYNLFFFSTFFLCAYTALFALKRMEVSSLFAVLCAVLFAFLPYHMLRYSHLLLTAYFMVPLVILAILWVLNGNCVFRRSRGESCLHAFIKNKKLLYVFVVCLVASSTGFYYAFFSCFFIVAAWIIMVFSRNKGDKVPLLPLAMLAVFVIGVLLNYLPNILYALITGDSGVSQSNIRTPFEAEQYAFMLVTLILPQPAHRSELMQSLAERYTQSSQYINENLTAALGLIAAIGLLILLFLVFRRPKNSDGLGLSYMKDLSVLNFAGFLLGTVGGLGALIAYTLNTGIIRGYCRLSVYIGFFALACIGIFLTYLKRKHAAGVVGTAMSVCLVVALMVFGLWDQTYTVYHSADEQSEIVSKVDMDRAFVQGIETQTKTGALIFELPYSSYPWGPEYPLLKGFIYSDNLRWSFGGVVGGKADTWTQEVSSLPANEMVERLRQESYSGIYVDLDVYRVLAENPDEIVQMQDSLTALLGEPQHSADATKLYYPLMG